MNKRDEAGLFSAATALLQLPQMSRTHPGLCCLHGPRCFFSRLSATGQLLHRDLNLPGRCNYYLHSKVATLPHLQGPAISRRLRLAADDPCHRYARPLASTLVVSEPPCLVVLVSMPLTTSYHDLCNPSRSPLVQYENRPGAAVMRSSVESTWKQMCYVPLYREYHGALRQWSGRGAVW